MYYLYYGIWYSFKSRLSPKAILTIQLTLLALVALVGLGIIFLGLFMLGGI